MMTTLELLLLLLLVSLVVIGTTVAVTLKRIFGAICLVTDPIATVLERLKGQEWQERHLLRHAAGEEPRDLTKNGTLTRPLKLLSVAIAMHSFTAMNARKQRRRP